MSRILTVRGGVPLKGRVQVRGAKNLVPKAMVAALLGNSPSTLRNVPEIKDVEVVTSLLQIHGITVDKDSVTGDLTMDPANAKKASSSEINTHAGDSRIPILLCGPLIHSIGHAFIPDLGGCKIGDRPIDYHLDVLRQFGALEAGGCADENSTTGLVHNGTKLAQNIQVVIDDDHRSCSRQEIGRASCRERV